MRAGLIAALLILPALAAAEDKPAYKFHGRLIEVTVTIDDALKKHSGLYDNLLAEGKRDAAKWNAQAEQDSQEIQGSLS